MGGRLGWDGVGWVGGSTITIGFSWYIARIKYKFKREMSPQQRWSLSVTELICF